MARKIDVGTEKVPDKYYAAHNLCLLLHDIMVEALRSGEENKIFYGSIKFSSEEDRKLFEQSSDIFKWLEKTEKNIERGQLLKTIVLPAILSDALLCFFNALKTSEQAGLNVTYILLRKPLQESLFVLESIILDPTKFGDTLSSNPLKLSGTNAGDVTAHEKRIEKILGIIDDDRFDAGYLAELRYDKSSEDSFAGICNQAMHLFTSHPAIRTSKLNINFIFSGPDEKDTQWAFLYSRLPYLLTYFHIIVEHILKNICLTDPKYLKRMSLWAFAQTCLWANTVEDEYRNTYLSNFVNLTHKQLAHEFESNGYKKPNKKDIEKLALSGILR